MPKDLTPEELALIAGNMRAASDDEEDGEVIVVTASPPPPPPPIVFLPPSPLTPPPPPVTGGPNPVPPPHPEHPNADCSAEAIAADIRAKPNSHYLEYQGIVYRHPDGSIRQSPALTSNQANTVNLPIGWYNLPPGWQMIGIVHNHPHFTLQDPSTGVIEPIPPESHGAQSYPSHADMINMNNYVRDMKNAGIPASQAEQYGIWIEFNGALRRFNWKDQDWNNIPPSVGPGTWAKEAPMQPCA